MTDAGETPGSAVYEELAAFTGATYLRYSFTRGTEQEADFLVDALRLRPGAVVVDVGCGPGRHSHALARRGMRVVGVDLAAAFLAVAAGAPQDGTAAFVRGDARALPLRPGAADAVVCLCQGGFGLLGGGGGEAAALAAIAGVLRPGGRLALTAFSAYFAVRHLDAGEELDAGSGVVRERATVRNAAGDEREFILENSCFTPRELRLLAGAAGLEAEGVWSVEPGRYGRNPPTADRPEWLMVAAKAGATLISE